ncbi:MULTISPECIES: hypothetical protein [Commensalibacter]|uniref:Uncharacterized protein n=2 Tax=Commensalibacter TaxID=1079922 RepID=W7DTS8_9PROT|nr:MULTISPECIES: hypothetical protein [Commensalibacter]EUK17668.1 hypothetical protein COMX_09421 [Commensalibacter papalotli (ex Servin-Garciduenas et al. 2014)]CAI3954042.1 unnamed protein product [Commensalibacter papalotli (ex Botero et al. 2024)]CAI3954552.1 unnamed protein product [Commensalibacter papalotli (ex Botero et al. 2024)]
MSVDINIKLSEDREKTTLTFSGGGDPEAKIDLTQKELEDLIRVLGIVHWSMADGKPIPEIKGAQLKPAYQTKWAIQRDKDTLGTLLAFQHPGYGAVGFVLADDQAKEFAKALQKSVRLKKPIKN